MTAPPVSLSDRPPLDPAVLRRALEHLGVDACVEHAPDDPVAEASGLLAGLMAAVQWHIQARRPDADVIDLAYHEVRRTLGFPCPGCRSPHDCAVS